MEVAQKFGDLDFSKWLFWSYSIGSSFRYIYELQEFSDRYDSELDADYSPSELSGEDDPLEYDSQTDEPEPRLVNA